MQLPEGSFHIRIPNYQHIIIIQSLTFTLNPKKKKKKTEKNPLQKNHPEGQGQQDCAIASNKHLTSTRTKQEKGRTATSFLTQQKDQKKERKKENLYQRNHPKE